MSISHRASRSAVALLICLSAGAVACTGGDHSRPGDAGGNGTNGGPPGGGNAVGAPRGGGDGGAPVAPIKIPELHTQQGFPPEVVKHNLEEGYPDNGVHVKGIRELCGNNELCVTVVIEAREDDPTFNRCRFVMTDPPEGTSINRGQTITVVTGTSPCDSPSPDGGGDGGESPGTGEQSPGDGEQSPDSAATPDAGPASPLARA